MRKVDSLDLNLLTILYLLYVSYPRRSGLVGKSNQSRANYLTLFSFLKPLKLFAGVTPNGASYLMFPKETPMTTTYSSLGM